MTKQRLLIFLILLSVFSFVLGMATMNKINQLSASAIEDADCSYDIDANEVGEDKIDQMVSNNDQYEVGKEADRNQKTKGQMPIAEDISSDPVESSSELTEQSGYLIDVDISDQKVRIYEDGELVQEWIASTGVNDATPLGEYTIQNRGEWFFSEKYQQGAKWWVSFKDWGVYLFHSLPMDRQQNLLADEADKLGTPASHGCVRLTEENAKWIYDNIPQGTPVNIHN